MNFYGAKQLQYVNESNGPQTETLTYNLLGSLAMQHILGVYVAMKKVCFAPFVAWNCLIMYREGCGHPVHHHLLN